MKEKSIYSQASLISRKGVRTASKLFEMRDKDIMVNNHKLASITIIDEDLIHCLILIIPVSLL